MSKKAIPRIDVRMEELEKVLERARKEPLDEEGYAKLKASLETLGYLVELVENKDTTIHRLRQILFGSSTEKTSQVLPTEDAARQAGNPTVNPKVPKEKASGEKSKGHGRNGAEAYSGAEKVQVAHESLKPGDHRGAETRLSGTDSAGGAGRSRAQRRHHDEDPGDDAGTIADRGVRGGEVGTHRGIHFRDRVDARRTEDRTVFHGPQACRGELGRGAVEAGLGVRSTDPDVRRPFAQSAQGISGDPG